VREVIFRKLGKARIFGDYNSFKERIRRKIGIKKRGEKR
jgi:hypothetical protein